MSILLSLLLASLPVNQQKTYESCDKRGRCIQVSAVQRNIVLISDHIDRQLSFLPEGFQCRIALEFRPDGYFTKIHITNCTDSPYAPQIFKALTDAAPYTIFPEAYHQIKQLTININKEILSKR